MKELHKQSLCAYTFFPFRVGFSADITRPLRLLVYWYTNNLRGLVYFFFSQTPFRLFLRENILFVLFCPYQSPSTEISSEALSQSDSLSASEKDGGDCLQGAVLNLKLMDSLIKSPT